jgi:hypothetical protein
MHPSSRRVGPTSARNSASRNGSCPPRALSKTTSVTASFGSLPSLDPPRLRGRLVPALRLPADFLAARLAIRPGLYSNPAKTPAPRTCSCRLWRRSRDKREHRQVSKAVADAIDPLRRDGPRRRSEIARYFSSLFRPAFKLSKFKIVFSTNEYVPRVSPR